MYCIICYVNWCEWSGAEIISLIISILGIICTFFGAALGAYLGYRYAIKVQKEEKRSKMIEFLNRLFQALKTEVDSKDKIKNKILNNSNVKVIELPCLEKAVQFDSLSIELYVKLKDLQGKVNRINFWYSNKNDFWEKYSNNDYLIKAWDRLNDNKELTFNLSLEDLVIEDSMSNEDYSIVTSYIADCKSIWRDINTFYKFIDTQNILGDIKAEKQLFSLKNKS